MPPGDALCLSIRQPWAWLIVAGHKPVENRTWALDYRGPILIHAGRKLAEDADLAREAMRVLGVKPPARYEMGGIIGCARLVDCVGEHESPWFEGPLAFVLAQPQALPFRALRGQLRIFRVGATPAEWAAIQALR